MSKSGIFHGKSNPRDLVSLWVILIIFFLSCTNKSVQVETDVSYRKTDFCSADEDNSYEVYLPSRSKKCNQLPLLIILDPHGKGASAIELFIPAAEQYKFMLVASNLIRNSTPDFVSRIHQIRKDVLAKYPANDQFVIAGFSGGARMAITYAQYNSVDGVIACGALAPPEQISAVRSVVYSLTGMADFNFVEAAQFLFRPENSPENLRIEFTAEIHRWPNSAEIERLVGYLYFANNFSTTKCMDSKSLMNAYLLNEKNRSTELITAKDYIGAYLLVQNLTHLDAFQNSDIYLKIYNSANYNDYLNDQLNSLRESIRFELQVRDSYYQELAVKDISWWQQEILSLNERIENEEDSYDVLAYKRIKAFLGIMCFSLSNNALQNKDLQTASRLLPVYAYLEPENPDMFYFRALYYSFTGNLQESRVYLNRALEAGFSDENKILELKSRQ